MASMTIRNLDADLKARLRVQAAVHGHSMEEEARDILRAALCTEGVRPGSLFDAIRAEVEPLGGVELDIPERSATRPAPEFGE